MLTVDEVAAALRATRIEFAKLFWQAQTQTGIAVDQRKEFEVIGRNEPDDKQAFKAALEFANQNGFLFLLCVLVTNSGLENGTIAKFVIQKTAANEASLQAMANPPAGFTEPLLFSMNIMKSTQLTGKVLINSAAKGTGVLIGPNLFLTAWHVIRDMFELVKDQQGQDVYELKKQNIPTLDVEFNSILDIKDGAIQPVNIIKVAAHQNWLVAHSVCHDSELAGIVPNPLTELKNYCDYAIIRLAKTIGKERRWATPDSRVQLPATDANIVLFQHPNGIPLKMDYSKIVDMDPPDPAVIPKYRFLHSLNTTGGSSGGPCFDKEFSLIGIHQGAWPTKINGQTTNRGVPIANIIEDYKSKISELPSPDPNDCPTWCLDKKSYKPVIGCDDFQAEIWKSTILGKPKLITTSGYERTGKTYLVDIISSILNDADHLKIIIPGEVIAKADALSIAQSICKGAGASLPDFVPLVNYNNTPAAWMKDEVIPKLINALETQRNNRIVWICITDLNKVDIKGENASDFLFLLYEQLLANKWLRITLDGMRADIPASLNEFTYRHRTREITQQDIEYYLRRGLAEFNLNVGVNSITANAKFLYNNYQEKLQDQQEKAIELLSEQSHNFLMAYL